ncbi:MAG TPA: WbuC family cupin fold metalloprotein [Magnetospirillum sp.]|nr:WbuC family cupin fold metalloprotein [Magnetospirillum sp.]
MKTVSAGQLADMGAAAAAAPRRRTHFNLHDDLSDPVQRIVIVLQPGTYVRPHRHAPHVWELFAVLQGALAVLVFDESGTVQQRIELRPGGDRMVQLDPGCRHALAVLEPDTVALELKPGPYVATTDKDFVAWAPAEGEPGAAEMVRWMERAQVGERA